MPDRSRHLVWLDEFQVASAGPSFAIDDDVSLPVMAPAPDWADWYRPAFGPLADAVTDLHEQHNLIHLTHTLTGRVRNIRACLAVLPPASPGPPPFSGPVNGSGRMIQLITIRPRRPTLVVPDDEQLLGYLVELQR